MQWLYGDWISTVFIDLLILNYLRKLQLMTWADESLVSYVKSYRKMKNVVRKSLLSVMKSVHRIYVRWKIDTVQRHQPLRKQFKYNRSRRASSYYLRNVHKRMIKINKRPNRFARHKFLLGMAAVDNEVDEERFKFDTDSFDIGVDNRTSYSMSGNVKDFITPIKPTNNYWIRGISGAYVRLDGVGTIG